MSGIFNTDATFINTSLLLLSAILINDLQNLCTLYMAWRINQILWLVKV